MSRLQPQVQRVIKSQNISVHDAQLILTKFLKDQKKINHDMTDSISDVDPYKEGEEDVLGFVHEDDDAGKFEEIQRRLNGILNSISGHKKKTSSLPVHLAPNDAVMDKSAVESISLTKVEDIDQTSNKELKSLEKARKAEEKARKKAEKAAKKAAKKQQKAEKKAAKAEKKLAKKRKSKDLDEDSSRSVKRTKKEEE